MENKQKKGGPVLEVRSVRGGYRRMGRELAEAAGREKLAEALGYYANFTESSLRHVLGERVPDLAMRGVREAVNRLFYRPLVKRLTPRLNDYILGVTDASGLPYEDIARGFLAADVMEWTMALAFALQPDDTPQRLQFPGWIGCSSVGAWGPSTVDGRLYYGRNFDYFGVGVFDRGHGAYFYEPEGGLRYVSISSSLSPVIGVTGMNEAGLTAAPHSLFTRHCGPGTPIMALMLEILHGARSIEDAISICKKLGAAAGWAIVLTHAARKEAAIVELSRRRVEVHPARGSCFAQTNFYHTDAHRRGELDFSLALRANLLGRYRRLGQLLDEHRGAVDPQRIAHFLGDHTEPETGRERALGDVISSLCNVSSVVISPEERIAWAGVGLAPCNHRRYLPVDVSAVVDGGDPTRQPALKARILEPHPFSATVRAEGFERYKEAYLAAEDRLDHREALEKVEAAIALDPGELLYRLVRTKLLLRLGRCEEARRAAEEGLDLEDTAHRRAALHLWAGRASDLSGRRKAGREHYRLALRLEERGVSASLARAARRGLFIPYRASSARRIHIEFILGDVISY